MVRDPATTLVSEFKQKLAKSSPAAAARDVNEFAKQQIWVGPGGEGEVPLQFGSTIWEFYVDFWKCHNSGQSDVLVVAFEHLKKDLKRHILAISDFMGLGEPSDDLMEKVLYLGSFEYMSAHAHLFEDRYITKRLQDCRGGPSGWVESAKVGLGAAEDVTVALNDATRHILDEKWAEIVTPATGLASYAEMIAALSLAPP